MFDRFAAGLQGHRVTGFRDFLVPSNLTQVNPWLTGWMADKALRVAETAVKAHGITGQITTTAHNPAKRTSGARAVS